MVKYPFETKSDSFYFVAVDDDVEKLILHNKAGKNWLTNNQVIAPISLFRDFMIALLSLPHRICVRWSTLH